MEASIFRCSNVIFNIKNIACILSILFSVESYCQIPTLLDKARKELASFDEQIMVGFKHSPCYTDGEYKMIHVMNS